MDKQTILNSLDIKTFYSSELPSFKSNGSGMGQALCPFHNDTKPSLTVNLTTGFFKCFGCDKKGSIFDFYIARHGVDYKDAFNALAKEAGLTTEAQRKVVKTYDYVDESGKLLFQTVRYEPKDFKQRRPDGKGGWIYNLQGVELVPYNLPHVLKAQSVIIAEGEKDVETLKAIGLIASCNPMGAGKWKPEYNHYFKGKKVVIIPDADKPGRDHVLQVAKNLKSIVESVKVVELPDLKEKGDVSDWIQTGGTGEGFLKLIETTPEWEQSNSPDIYTETKGLIDSLLKWNDILSLDVKTEYLLDKLIPKGSITMLFGRGGIGKTSLCLQIARAIAEGMSFGDLQTIKTLVYYLDWENPLSVLKEHVEKKGQADNLYVWHISNEIQPPKLDGKNWELFKQLPPGLIMVDTMRAAHLSDEDKSKDMAIILDRLKQLREKGFTIVFLSHTPKGNEGIYKGSTAQLDLADHILSIEEVKGNEEERIEFDKENLYRFGTRIKTRYNPYHIYLRFNPDIKGFEIAKDPDYELIEAIYELLSGKEELNTNQVYELVKKELDIKGKGQVLKLLKKGEGKYWDAEKRGRAVYYRSKVQPIYSETIRPMNENGLKDSTPDTSQALDNSIKSNSPDSMQTDRPINKNDRCSFCMLTPAQRALCEVIKPCPVENQSHIKI